MPTMDAVFSSATEPVLEDSGANLYGANPIRERWGLIASALWKSLRRTRRESSRAGASKRCRYSLRLVGLTVHCQLCRVLTSA